MSEHKTPQPAGGTGVDANQDRVRPDPAQREDAAKKQGPGQPSRPGEGVISNPDATAPK